MKFESLRIENFRNIESQNIDLSSKNIVLEGINGQGKTNLLEAIYVLCYGSSFRTFYLKECIRHNSPGFFISGDFIDEDNLKERISCSFFDNKRKITIGNKEVRDRKELIYRFPCIVFCHNDILFINGEPEERRKFFDQMIALYSPLYFDEIRQYKKLLLQRNAALKSQEPELSSIYNERMARLGIEIMETRKRAVDDFNYIFSPLYSEISKSDLSLKIEYQPSWGRFSEVSEIVSHLESTFERDVKLSTTTSGIHRDRYVIQSQYGLFSSLGSTGQMRLCSILFRICESIYFKIKTDKDPIFLVDDVLLELDSEKRKMMLDRLNGFSQAYYTFLPFENYHEKMENASYYKVESGRFSVNE